MSGACRTVACHRRAFVRQVLPAETALPHDGALRDCSPLECLGAGLGRPIVVILFLVVTKLDLYPVSPECRYQVAQTNALEAS